MYGANGVMAAYIHRLKTGQGQHVDTSLLEAGIALTLWETGVLWATNESPYPMGSAHRINAPYQALRCKDQYITIGAANQANWERLCHALDREELLEDPRFTTGPDRREHYEELAEELETTLMTMPADHWLPKLEEEGVPSGPLNDMAQVYQDRHVLARDMVVELEHPTAGLVKSIGIPVKLSESPGSIRRPAPLLGQHSEEVLREHGFSDDEVGGLMRSSVIRAPD
jgi:formyl-CoA transferase